MTHQKLEIKELLSSFQDYLTYEKGLSENTVAVSYTHLTLPTNREV